MKASRTLEEPVSFTLLLEGWVKHYLDKHALTNKVSTGEVVRQIIDSWLKLQANTPQEADQFIQWVDSQREAFTQFKTLHNL